MRGISFTIPSLLIFSGIFLIATISIDENFVFGQYVAETKPEETILMLRCMIWVGGEEGVPAAHHGAEHTGSVLQARKDSQTESGMFS